MKWKIKREGTRDTRLVSSEGGDVIKGTLNKGENDSFIMEYK